MGPATPAASGEQFNTYVDPIGQHTVDYPAGWRLLSEDEIAAEFASAGNRAVEPTIASIGLVAVSPDGRAVVAYTRHPRPEGASLSDVVQDMRTANAATVSGIEEIGTEPQSLGGEDAVRLSFYADDPVSGAPRARLIQQLVSMSNDTVVTLSFIVRADAAAEFADTVRQIAESWRWGPTS